MKLKHAFLALTLAAFASCKKEETPTPVEPKSPVQTEAPVKPAEAKLSYGLADVAGLKPTMSYDEATRTHNFAQFLAWRAQDPKKYMPIAWQGNLVQAMFTIDYYGKDYQFNKIEHGDDMQYWLLSEVCKPENINRKILHYLIHIKCQINILSKKISKDKLLAEFDDYKSGSKSLLAYYCYCNYKSPNEEERHWIHLLIQNGADLNRIYSDSGKGFSVNEKYLWKSDRKTFEFTESNYWGTILDMIIARCKDAHENFKVGLGMNDPLIQQLRDYGCVTFEEAIKNPALQQMSAKPEAIKKYAELGKIEKVWEDPKFIEEWHAKYRKDLQDLKDSQ